MALAGIIAQDRRDDRDKRRLSATRGADDHEELAALNFKINAPRQLSPRRCDRFLSHPGKRLRTRPAMLSLLLG